MNKLDALIEAAKSAAVLDHNEQEGWYSAEVIAEQGAYYTKNARFIAACDPNTILGLCALLEKAEECLESQASPEDEGFGIYNKANEVLAEIKRWKYANLKVRELV